MADPESRMAGSNTLSASGPAISMAAGVVMVAITSRTENTRPCRFGGTFDCQIAWLDALIIGPNNAPTREAAIHTGT